MATVTTRFCDCCGQKIDEKIYKNRYSFQELMYEGSLTSKYVTRVIQLDICDTCANDFDDAIEQVFNAHKIVPEETVEGETIYE